MTDQTTAAGNTPGRPALTEQLAALEALIVIGRTFAHLPGAHLELNPLDPGLIVIRVHDDLDGFEQWRTALGIAADDIEYRQRPNSTHMTLKATTTFARATVELVGFAAALPAPDGGAR